MKKFIVFTSMAFLVVSLLSGFAVATEINETPDIYEDLAQMCEYYPQECEADPLGAGNGGGNEPPYTPRKPAKKTS